MVRATGHDFKADPADFLPEGLKQQVIDSVAEKLATTEERLVAAKLERDALRAGHAKAQQAYNAGIHARGVNLRRAGVGIKTAEDIEASIQVNRFWKAVRAAEEQVVALDTLRRDLILLQRRAQMGLRSVIVELAQRMTTRLVLGGAVVLRQGEDPWGAYQNLRRDAQATRDRMAAMTNGQGSLIVEASGPIARLQRRLERRRQAREAREVTGEAAKVEAEKETAKAEKGAG